MKKISIVVCMVLCLTLLLCACEEPVATTTSTNTPNPAETTQPILTFDPEIQNMINELGDDLHVIEQNQFDEVVASFSSEDVGAVYQIAGYYQSEEGADGKIDLLANADGSVSIQLRYLYEELSQGSSYTILGILTEESHGEHNHMYLDVIAVATR